MIVIFLLLSSECWVGYTDYCTITSESTIRHWFFYSRIVVVALRLEIWIVLILVHSLIIIIVIIVIIVINVGIISLVIHIISSLSIWSIIVCYYILFHRFYLLQQWIYFLWKTFLHFLVVMGRLTNVSVHISTLIVHNSWWYSSTLYIISIIFLYSLLFIRSSPLPSWSDIRIHPSISS